MHLALRVTLASSSASASGLPSVATAKLQWRSAERATRGLAPAPTSNTVFPAHWPTQCHAREDEEHAWPTSGQLKRGAAPAIREEWRSSVRARTGADSHSMSPVCASVCRCVRLTLHTLRGRANPGSSSLSSTCSRSASAAKRGPSPVQGSSSPAAMAQYPSSHSCCWGSCPAAGASAAAGSAVAA